MTDKPMHPDSKDERRNEVLVEIKSRVEAEMLPEVEKFENWSSMPRILFRLNGTLVIILSISLPLLSTWDEGKDFVPIVATAVALLTAFNAFFSWDQIWKTNFTTARLLRNALKMWEAKMLRAKHHSDPEAGIEIAQEEYEALINTVYSITAQNTTTYFSNVKPPDVASRK